MNQLSCEQLIDFDKHHIWHPYASIPNLYPVLPVASARGTRLTLMDGRELIDGMSSWWAAIHGYNHPVLNKALQEQINRMSHVMFGGLTHEPGVLLASKLIEITPEPLQKVFFVDSGSVSVEVAIKIAIQYWFSQDKKKKHKLLTVKSGYHGDTLGAMSVCDPVSGMHNIFSGVLPVQLFADAPPMGYERPLNNSDIDSFHKLIAAHYNEIAAVIIEPIVQASGGMRFYSPEFLRRVRDLCNQYDVLLIADEIATGFGRSGRLFGCEHAGIVPDIMCLGKALTGGYMTLAATLTTNRVCDEISAGTYPVLMHGPTFMGNPLACALARANIDLLLESSWQERVRTIENRLKKKLEPAREISHVVDVRVLGAIGVIELVRSANLTKITDMFVKQGVWLRPFRNLVYTMPPYIIEMKELDKIADVMVEAVAERENMQ